MSFGEVNSVGLISVIFYFGWLSCYLILRWNNFFRPIGDRNKRRPNFLHQEHCEWLFYKYFYYIYLKVSWNLWSSKSNLICVYHYDLILRMMEISRHLRLIIKFLLNWERWILFIVEIVIWSCSIYSNILVLWNFKEFMFMDDFSSLLEFI